MMDDYFTIGTTYVKPKSYMWKPKEDITAYELALCAPMLINGQGWNGDIEPFLLALPESASRHFEEIKP